MGFLESFKSFIYSSGGTKHKSYANQNGILGDRIMIENTDDFVIGSTTSRNYASAVVTNKVSLYVNNSDIGTNHIVCNIIEVRLENTNHYTTSITYEGMEINGGNNVVAAILDVFRCSYDEDRDYSVINDKTNINKIRRLLKKISITLGEAQRVINKDVAETLIK